MRTVSGTVATGIWLVKLTSERVSEDSKWDSSNGGMASNID